MSKIPMLLRDSANEIKNPKAIIGAALLISLNIALDRFTIIVSPTLHISFSFITKALTGILYGPVVALYAGVLNDIIGYLLYPKGAFFIGFTISAALTGFIYGLFLYKKKLNFLRVFLAQAAVTVIINLCLNTVWLSIMYNKAAIALLMARLLKNVIFLPIESSILFFVTGAIIKAVSALKHG